MMIIFYQNNSHSSPFRSLRFDYSWRKRKSWLHEFSFSPSNLWRWKAICFEFMWKLGAAERCSNFQNEDKDVLMALEDTSREEKQRSDRLVVFLPDSMELFLETLQSFSLNHPSPTHAIQHKQFLMNQIVSFVDQYLSLHRNNITSRWL